MARLPSIGISDAVTPQVRSSVSGADVARASPFAIAARGFQSLGQAAVEIGDEYERGVELGVTTAAIDKGRTEALRMSEAAKGDPAVFQSAWQQWADAELATVPERYRPAVAAHYTDIGGNAYRGIIGQTYERDRRIALDRVGARQESILSDLGAMARAGQADSERYRSLTDEYAALDQEKASNPFFAISQERIALERSQAEGRLVAEAVIGEVTRGGLQENPVSVVDRIVGVESGGVATADNPNSSALGAGQFIASTWLATVKRYRPDLASGKSDEQILALRTDAALSREMTARHADENAQALAATGHTASADNIYLAHFLGIGGAIGVLEAAPGTPVRDALIAGGMSAGQADAAIAANKSVLDGKTVGDVQAWARAKMGSDKDPATIIESTIWNPDLPLSLEDRRRYAGYVMQEVNRADSLRTQASGVVAEGYERQIIDSASSNGPIMPRSVIENDPALTETNRNTLLRQYDAAAKDVLAQQHAYDRFASGDSFNPYDADDRKALDGIFTMLGGDGPALKTVVEQSGTAPPAIVKGLRGDFASGDPQRTGTALQVASNLMAANQQVFAGHEGASDIETATTTFRHYVDDLGYTAEQATARYVEMNTPEYKAKVAARVKNEDLTKLVADNLSVGELRSAFDTSIWSGAPELAFDPETRQGMFSDYAELFRDRYLETGDVGLAKTQAQAQLKRTWGVTRVGGAETIVRYPPEGAPGMAGVENASDLIAAEAIADLREAGIGPGVGVAVDRDSLRILPIPGMTADAYKSGQPVPYMLTWSDDDGLIHTLPPGRAFVLDAAAIRARETAAATASRSEAFATERQVLDNVGNIIPQPRDFTADANPSPLVDPVPPLSDQERAQLRDR